MSHNLKIDLEKIRKTSEHLDKLESFAAISVIKDHSDYQIYAGRLFYEYHRNHICPKKFEGYFEKISDLLNEDCRIFISENLTTLSECIEKHRYKVLETCTYMSMKLLFGIYAFDSTVELPEYLWMRVAVQNCYKTGTANVLNCYVDLIEGWYTPATPTILNSGFTNNQLISCFLLDMQDNTESIADNTKKVCIISKKNGGIGLNMSKIRHSRIKRGGESKGVVKTMGIFDRCLEFFNQGGKRNGVGTMFLRTHHKDLKEFIMSCNKDSPDYFSNLFTCLWTSRLFWERVFKGQNITLFCPKHAKILKYAYSFQFDEEYEKLERDPLIEKKVIPAREIHSLLMAHQRMFGQPFLMNADAVNDKSNHKNIGPINSSNLCLEIVQHTGKNMIATCNLTSINLAKFVISKYKGNFNDCYDFALLSKYSRDVCVFINNNVDLTETLFEEVRNSHYNVRSIGCTSFGLSEVIYELDLCYEDPKVLELVKMIYACMYFNLLVQSVDLSIRDGPYKYFKGSPFSEGKLQFDLWADEYKELKKRNMIRSDIRKESDDFPILPTMWNQEIIKLFNGHVVYPTWDSLKNAIKLYGTRNSMLNCIAPTASTSQIRCKNENISPPQNNLYRRDLAVGEFLMLNPYLVKDFEKVGLWGKKVIDYLQNNLGNIENIHRIWEGEVSNGTIDRVKFLEKKYKTVWKISQKFRIDLIATISRYIDQSISSSLNFNDPNDKILTASHLHAYYSGLKTMVYYTRQSGRKVTKISAPICSAKNEECLSCS